MSIPEVLLPMQHERQNYPPGGNLLRERGYSKKLTWGHYCNLTRDRSCDGSYPTRALYLQLGALTMSAVHKHLLPFTSILWRSEKTVGFHGYPKS